MDRNDDALVATPPVTKKEVIPPEIETVHQPLDLAAPEAHPLFPYLFVLTYTGRRKGEPWGFIWRLIDLLDVAVDFLRNHRARQEEAAYRVPIPPARETQVPAPIDRIESSACLQPGLLR